MDVLIHAANLLLLASFATRNMLALRALNVVASGLFITYLVAQPTPVWASVGWNALFASINLYQSWRAIVGLRPPRLTAEAQRLHAVAFPAMPLWPYKRLLDLGRWHDALPPALLAQAGATPERLWMLSEGTLELRRADGDVRAVRPGEFVGEGAFLTAGPMRGDVVATAPVRLLSWPVDALRAALERDAELAFAVQRALGEGLVKKLEAPQT
jgi:CRP-like cAMP-binding protein